MAQDQLTCIEEQISNLKQLTSIKEQMKKAVADEDFEEALFLKQKLKQINLKAAHELTSHI